MARPKIGVTFDNSNKVYRYFKKVLSDAKRRHLVLVEDKDVDEALSHLHSVSLVEKEVSGNKALIPDPEVLQSWVDLYITDSGWKRCQANLRQKRFSSGPGREKLQIKLDRLLVDRIKRHASLEGVSLEEFLAMTFPE